MPVQGGTKITVRCEIQGNPPDFNGDYNKHVTQDLEIALRQRGFEPVPEGGMVLQVRAQISNSGKSITVRPIGAPPPRPGLKGGQPVKPNQEQVYPIEQITASLVLTDTKGTAVWKNENTFHPPRTMIFKTDNIPREMQEPMWRAFDSWLRGPGIATIRP
jgi:hypothetical protein